MSPSKQFKVAIVGDANVGKTCLLSLFTHDTCKRHLDHYIPTTGVDFCPKSFEIDGDTYNFHFCDVSGMSQLNVKQYYTLLQHLISKIIY